MLFEKY